jgi:SAM-dependent methyltransferase
MFKGNVRGEGLAPRYWASNPGFCHCCRENTVFEEKGEWLRDYYFCQKCGSIPRQRNLQNILDKFFPDWEKSIIHESSPSNNFLSRYCSNYSSSQFMERVQKGSYINGVQNQDLENLTFSDSTFQLFITQDVFEHIFNPDIAIREIMRVLKPGGSHVFTAPKHRNLKRSFRRAQLTESGEVANIHPEIYHGNPVGDGSSLVTWDWGDDFEDLLAKWSGYPVRTYVTRDRNLGLDGEYLEVFICRKPEVFAS